MSHNGVLRLPARILFGPGVRSALPSTLERDHSRVFVVADRFLAGTPEFLEVATSLSNAGHEALVYTEIEPELPLGSLVSAGEAARDFRPNVILGYGGGSALDAAKLVALLATHGGQLQTYYGENAVPGPVTPLIAIPTTAGTGSEVTPVAVVTDPDREMKVGISSPYLIPNCAIVDPVLTFGAPPAVTAHSGIDAFVHAVESYTAREIPSSWPDAKAVFVGANQLTAPLSLEAIGLIAPHLARVVTDPTDHTARVAMSRGSLLAGMAFGSTGTHLSHALQYPIGAVTHTPHGLGTGLMLPYVLQAIATVVPGLVSDIGRAMSGDARMTPSATIDAIEALNQAIGIPRTLQEIGVRATDIPRMAGLAMQATRLVKIAPCDVTQELLEGILMAALRGDRTLVPA